MRKLKNALLHNYYSSRIYASTNPYKVLFRSKPYKALFIFSHMRSGSSLLTHILNTNPEIIGFGETHIQYTSEAGLKELLYKVYWQIRHRRMSHTYVLDKLLHNNKLLSLELLRSNQLYTLFLLREPQASLASILKLKPNWDSHQAVEHYVNRLAMLETYAKEVNDQSRAIFITYEQLVNQTGDVLKQLQSFFKVKQAFSEEYQVTKTTGVKGIGDSSPNIKAGRILRTHSSSHVAIAPELLDKAMAAFMQCQATLEQYCTVVPTVISPPVNE